MKLEDAHDLVGAAQPAAASGSAAPVGPGPSAETTVGKLRRRIIQLECVEQNLREARREIRALEDLNRRLTEQTRHAEAALAGALQTIEAFKVSTSWKLTSPIRGVIGPIRSLRLGLTAWLLFRPGSRPRRTVRRAAVALGLTQNRPALAVASEAAPSVQIDIDKGPKRQRLYVLVDACVYAPQPGGDQQIVRSLCAELLESDQIVRLVKWDPAMGCCVLLDRDDLARLDQWDGPALTLEQADPYPAPGVVAPARSRSGSGSWLIAAETPSASLSALIDWAKAEGLKTGVILHGTALGAAAADAGALLRADVVWPTSAWAAEHLTASWAADSEAAGVALPTVRPATPPARFGRSRVARERTGSRLALYAGDIGPGADPSLLMQTFAGLLRDRPGSGWSLALAGRVDPTLADSIRALSGPAIAIHVQPSAAEMAALFERAAFTVCIAETEAGRMQVLESLWEAKPCLCPSSGPAAEAAAEGGCLALDTRDPGALKVGLARLMDQVDLRRRLAEEAILRPTKSWADYRAELEASGPGAESLIYYWVDSTINVPVNTGIQRVVRQLARSLIEAGFKLVPVKWGNMDDPLYPVDEVELEHFAKWNGPAPESWHAYVHPRTHHGGGWFMMNELPHNLAGLGQKTFRSAAEAAGLKTAAVFYDTIPWKMADLYPEEFARLHLSYIGELANYTKVIAISEYSGAEMKSVLSDEFQVPRSRLDHIIAVPLAAEFPEKGEMITAPRRRDDGAIEILCVGTVEPRKNHERLLDAFDLARQQSTVPMHLTIVGGGHSFDPDLPDRVRDRIAGDTDIDWEQKADDARIKMLYGRCDFTIYPSVEEGFGMPILESLWYGKPAICANFGAMQEVAAEGGGCVTVDVRDANALADAICDLANSPERLSRLAGQAKARTFTSWAHYAASIAEALGLARAGQGLDSTRSDGCSA